MAKRTPFTAQQERLERLIENVRAEVADIKTMVDTERSVITAQIVKIDDPTSPQIIRVSEGGTLEAGSDSPMRVIGAITEEASHTGDTLETELGKITVPGGAIGPNGLVRINASFRAIGAGGNHLCKVYFGGQIFTSYASVQTNWMFEPPPKFVFNRGAENSQGAYLLFGRIHERTGEAPFNGAIDTTGDVDITFTGQNTIAGHSVHLRFALVEAFFQG